MTLAFDAIVKLRMLLVSVNGNANFKQLIFIKLGSVCMLCILICAIISSILLLKTQIY